MPDSLTARCAGLRLALLNLHSHTLALRCEWGEGCRHSLQLAMYGVHPITRAMMLVCGSGQTS